MKGKVTQQMVANYLGINNGDLSSMIKGRFRLSLDNARKIQNKTGWTLDLIFQTDMIETVSYVKYLMTVKT